MRSFRDLARTGALTLLFALPPAGVLVQTPPAAGPVVVKGAWIREATASQPSTAAYATLENPSASPVTLVGADIEGVGVVELHEMAMKGEMMSMAKVASIIVPARGAVELKPGGLHLMLFQRTRAFEPGTTAAITFRFSDGTSTTVHAEIRKKMAMGE
jgi:copper(I)-binding protein